MRSYTDQTKATEPQQEPSANSILIANRFILTDREGNERATLYVENELTLLAFNDRHGDPVFSIAVSTEGFVMMSANHRNDDDSLDSSFRLTVANGEPEMIMKDALFGDSLGINTRGFFDPASA